MTPQDMAFLRWSKTSPEERKAIAKRMNRKRNRYMPAAQRRAIARAGGIARAAQRKFRASLLKSGKAGIVNWEIKIRTKREGECGPGIWIKEMDGARLVRTVTDTGAIDAWPLSQGDKAKIEALPELLAALQMASNFYGEGLDETDETEMLVFKAIRGALAKAYGSSDE